MDFKFLGTTRVCEIYCCISMHCNKGQFENSDTKVIFGSTSPIDVNSVDQSNFKRNRRNKVHFLLLHVVAL